MNILMVLKDQDFGLDSEEPASWKERNAARCILKNGGKIALLHVTKRSYHKLPGGGIEPRESAEEALAREVREEVGSRILIGEPIGVVEEYRSRLGVHQTSVCFMASEKESGIPNFTEEEHELGFKVEWYPIEEVEEILKKDRPTDYEGKFIVRRDLIFLEKAKKGG